MIPRQWLFMAMLVTALPARAGDLGLVTATGFGFADESTMPAAQARLMATRAATVDAQRNLLSTIEGVRVTSGTTVRNMMVESDLIGTRVRGMLRGAFEIDSKVTEEEKGSWVSEVTLGICLHAGPAECKDRPTLSAVVQPGLAPPEPEQIYEPSAPDIAAASDRDAPGSGLSDPVTGLIVDVSGHGFSPMLDVRIRTAGGKEVYGPGHVSEGTDWLHWADSPSGARSMTDIVGESPMIVKVESIGEEWELIVSQEDALHIFHNNLAGGDFLRQGKVVLVIGHPSG